MQGEEEEEGQEEIIITVVTTKGRALLDLEAPGEWAGWPREEATKIPLIKVEELNTVAIPRLQDKETEETMPLRRKGQSFS